MLIAVFILVVVVLLLLIYFFIIKNFFMAAQYPYVQYHFQVEWGGTRIGFTEVSGLNIEIEAISVREGSSPVDSVRKIPGLRKYSNIVFKRGIVKGDNEFFNWINTKKMSTIERRDIRIILLDEEHKPAVTWKVFNAFPVKYEGPILNATASDIAIESLEITHDGIEVENN